MWLVRQTCAVVQRGCMSTKERIAELKALVVQHREQIAQLVAQNQELDAQLLEANRDLRTRS